MSPSQGQRAHLNDHTPVRRVAVSDSHDRPCTQQLDRSPTLIKSGLTRTATLTPDTYITLQVLPSGTCLTTRLPQPLILGRGVQPSGYFIDLSEFNAIQHGVSRQHCRLERAGDQLVLTDLNSTNGTHCNAERLAPDHAYSITDGDTLILGTLHILVIFTRLPHSSEL